MKTKKIEIKHARNGGEYLVPGTRYRADGYHAFTRTIYEFHGCVYHGCLTCYPDRGYVNYFKKTMTQAYADTQKKKEILTGLGYTYVEVWECDWRTRVVQLPDQQSITAFLGV